LITLLRAGIFLQPTGSCTSITDRTEKSRGHSRGHARHSGAKHANSSEARSAAITPAAQDQRHPEDLALDRKVKKYLPGLLTPQALR